MNIWVNCREIKWDENDPELPTSFKSFPLAEEWVENKTLKEAIDDKLSEYYDVKADCTDFTVYSEEESIKLDLQYLLGACHK